SERNTLLKVNGELNKFKLENEANIKMIKEANEKIEEQKEEYENLKLTKSEYIKMLISLKQSHEEQIKNKDDRISELLQLLELMQNAAEEKGVLMKKNAETLKSRAENFSAPDSSVNETKGKSYEEVNVKDKSIPESTLVDSKVQLTSTENKEIFSKCKLIAYESINPYSKDRTFEHFMYSNIHIVNINLTRATMDAAISFNKFLTNTISKERNRIIINLSECEYIDTSILGVLISGLKKVLSFKGGLILVWPHQDEYSMLSLTKMNSIFKIYDTLKAGINSFS
ncbi:MAG TPA: STAS domain-containing protein, partial [Ignavibacteriaceae bacterium]|nr:STAS domain-containing protein [Ignavibacteriaceae bacterium]